MSLKKIRTFLLLGWSLCLIIVIGIYAYAYFGPAPILRPATTKIITSLSTIVGLIAPHLTLALNFVLSVSKRGSRKVPGTQVQVLLTMCVGYWLTLVILLWIGIVNRSFSADYGRGIDETTSIVVAVSGLLSFLVIIPTTKLFGAKTET